MRRREFIAGLGGAAAAWTLPARAQQPAGKVRRIGWLGSGSPSSHARFIEAFRRGLRERGWVEGQNIKISYRFAEGRYDRVPALAAELVGLKVDLIFAAPTAAAVAAKNATATIPIVFAAVGDPVGLGLVASLARPGGNVTGLAFSVGFELFGKQLELLKEAVSGLHRVAVLASSANPSHMLAIDQAKSAGQSLGLKLQILQVRGPEEFDAAFVAMAQERAGALLVIPDSTFVPHSERLAQLAVKNRLPSMHGLREQVEAGGLLHYGHDIRDQFRQAASFVDKILRGAAPADLPVEQPTKFELAINLKTATALGLQIPPTRLARADEVIE
jgi:putative ABC transport system substrate-binding protein